MWPTGMPATTCLPQAKAVPATPQQRKLLEQEKAKFELQIAKEKEFAQEMATGSKRLPSRFHQKFTKPTSFMVPLLFETLSIAAEKAGRRGGKSMVLLNEPIKTIGTFKVPDPCLPGRRT
jgi:large subunit ribosomal protein L9